MCRNVHLSRAAYINFTESLRCLHAATCSLLPWTARQSGERRHAICETATLWDAACRCAHPQHDPRPTFAS